MGIPFRLRTVCLNGFLTSFTNSTKKKTRELIGINRESILYWPYSVLCLLSDAISDGMER